MTKKVHNRRKSVHKYIILVINGWFCIRFLIDSMLVVEGLICADNNGFQISIIYKCCSFITKRMQENETIMVTYNHTQQHELLHKPRSLQHIIPQRNSERSVYRVVPPFITDTYNTVQLQTSRCS